MTAIMTIFLDHGRQIIIASDTKHTYPNTVDGETKTKLVNNMLFCGAGYDDSIGGLLREVESLDDLNSCMDKIKNLKIQHQEMLKYETAKEDAQNIYDAEFIVADTKNVGAFLMRRINISKVSSFEIIGSGAKRRGDIKNLFSDYNDRLFDDKTKEGIFRDIIDAFLDIGKFDSNTGHPAIFPIEIFVLEKEKLVQKYILEFKKELLRDIANNYSLKAEELQYD